MTTRRLVACGLAAALTLLPAAPGAWGFGEPAPGPGPLGGPKLGTAGQVVRLAPGLPPLPKRLPASSWLVADAGTGAVLAAKDPHGRFLPASTLKVLTAITLLPRLDPRASWRVTPAEEDVGGSEAGLVAGHSYPVSMLFTAMLVASANDAAQALADAAGGSRKTLALMNAEAAHLNADDTHAGTPSGLDARGETSSAYDLALIGRAAIAMPSFRHYDQTLVSYVYAPGVRRFQIATHDRLLTSYPGAIGVKNGYTVAAQGTYIGAATRGGRTLIVTLMHATPDFWPMARALLDWGFAADGRISPVGELVPPGTPKVSAARGIAVRPVTARQRPAAAALGPPAPHPLRLPLEFAGVSAVLAGWLALRNRRRGYRRR